MNNTNLPVSLEDTTELRKLILENPEAPLVVFAGEEAWSDNYPYEFVEYVTVALDELTLYHRVCSDYLLPNMWEKVGY